MLQHAFRQCVHLPRAHVQHWRCAPHEANVFASAAVRARAVETANRGIQPEAGSAVECEFWLLDGEDGGNDIQGIAVPIPSEQIRALPIRHVTQTDLGG